MPEASKECYCNLSDLDLLALILEKQQDIFNRLQQLIETAESKS